MKRLFKLLLILLIFSCAGSNDVRLQDYYELRKNDFFIPGFTVDLEEIVEKSKLTGKPILFYFNSLGCVNCRKMEERVLGNRFIAKTIVENFLFIPLVVDDRTKIPVDQRQQSRFSKKMMRTVGTVNVDLAIEICKCGSQPYFSVVNAEKETLGAIGYTPNKRTFFQFLESSIEKDKDTVY